MSPQLRAFVGSYKRKPMPEMSLKEWMQNHNQELSQKCENCQTKFDFRKNDRCPKCNPKSENNNPL